MMGDQVPNAHVVCIGFNGGQMGGDVEVPSRQPTLQFWSQLRPLFFDACVVLSLMVQQQGCRLNQALDQQHLFLRSASFLQQVPHVFPSLVGVPEFPLIKQRQPLLEKRFLFRTKRGGRENHQFGRAGPPLKQFVLPHNRRTLQEGV